MKRAKKFVLAIITLTAASANAANWKSLPGVACNNNDIGWQCPIVRDDRDTAQLIDADVYVENTAICSLLSFNNTGTITDLMQVAGSGRLDFNPDPSLESIDGGHYEIVCGGPSANVRWYSWEEE